MIDFCGWMFFGLIAGVIAKFLMGGEGPSGWIITIVLGVVGAMVGGLIGQQLGFVHPGEGIHFDLKSFAIAVFGAILVLLVYRIVAPRFEQ